MASRKPKSLASEHAPPPSPLLSQVSPIVTPWLSPGAKTDLKLPFVEGLWGNLWAEESFSFL